MLEHIGDFFMQECPIFGMNGINHLHIRHLAFRDSGNYFAIVSVPACIEAFVVDYIKRTGNAVDNGFIESLGFIACFSGFFQIGYINYETSVSVDLVICTFYRRPFGHNPVVLIRKIFNAPFYSEFLLVFYRLENNFI